MQIRWKFAAPADSFIIGSWNHQLIRDEGHRNSMTVLELQERMRSWLQSDYKAIIFSAPETPVGYALFKENSAGIYLRQFFVLPEYRRKGLGRELFHVLRHEIWPKTVRLTVDVLSHNTPAIAFWRAVGYVDYSVTLEITPGSTLPD